MSKKLFVLLISLILIFTQTAAVQKEIESPEGGLVPGAYVVFNQTIPINVVFIGYSPDQIDLPALQYWLPSAYEPVVRYPRFYGLPGRPMGLHYDFSYRFKFADAVFQAQFFKYLTMIGSPGDPTLFQQYYNAQINNVRDVTAPVLYIDALAVEKYLQSRSKAFGISKNSYTVYFINWWGRPDFKFHVYTKTDEPDPDTGYNFGAWRASRKMIAWGGSYSRSWFYDLSAGPEAWTDNWNVDDPDLDGDGFPDYRMPPIWEYVPGGYHSIPGQISWDLGLVTRLVAINLLFTTSPLYDPLVTAPDLYGDKVAHVKMFEDDPASSGLDWTNIAFVRSAYTRFQPYYSWIAALEDNNPIDAPAQTAFRIFTGLSMVPDCWNAYGTPFAELFCFFDANYTNYVPAYDPDDYVAKFFSFNTTDANMGVQWGLLGFSDDNWVDGTQSYIFAFGTDTYRAMGYGFTSTLVHEGGHHIGLSHPHDGYDYQWDWDYGPSGDTYFAWSGDESNTVMHYISLSNQFGQFDQDNMYRFEFAGYMNWSNEVLGNILADPDAGMVSGLVKKAKTLGKNAEKAFKKWNYLQAATLSRQAYLTLALAARTIGIPTPTLVAPTIQAPTRMAPHEGDPIRFPDN